MLKNISNLGSVVTKTEQKTITGGRAAQQCVCEYQFAFCNSTYPDSYTNFNACMEEGDC